MQAPPAVEDVCRVVFTLYHNPDPSEKEKASAWLTEFQNSVFAWKLADEILHGQANLECNYFAAQTMRTKVQQSFEELPPESYIPLRDSLLEHINKVSQCDETIVFTQLCLSLAGLALQMVSWETPAIELVQLLEPSSCKALLEILRVLPEETYSRHLKLGSNRRDKIMEDLYRSLPSVLDYLERALSNYGKESSMQIKIMSCFISWVTIKDVDIKFIRNSPVVALAFQVVANNTLPNQNVDGKSMHDVASDCICCLLQKVMGKNNCEESLQIELFNGVMSLERSYHLAVAHEEHDKCVNYCRIFTELAESLLHNMISVFDKDEKIILPHFAMPIFDVVLSCVGHHDYEVAEITFHLWHELSEELNLKNIDSLTNMFKNYIERLIGSLCRHCQMEPDHEGLLDENDDFHNFRLKVSELINDVIFIVGSSHYFHQMFISLQSSNTTWEATESALFIMQSIGKNIDPEENAVVSEVVEAILNLPLEIHVAVKQTSLLLIGELSEWIEKHPDYLDPILQLILFSLQGDAANAAANCLQSICTYCKTLMAERFVGLLHVVQSLNKFPLSNRSAIGIMKGVGCIIGKLPYDQINDAMKEICVLQLTPLCEILTATNCNRGSEDDVCFWLDRLAAVFRSLKIPMRNGEAHPCQPVATQIWPVISSVWDKYQHNSKVMEHSCRCVRFIFRCLGRHGESLLEPIVKQMVLIYNSYQHSCMLYLGSIFVDEFVDGDVPPILLQMLEAFLTPTFNLFNQQDGLRSNPENVDDFFRLCSRFLQRATVAFLIFPGSDDVLNCGMMAIALNHRAANSSVMKFFYDLAHAATSNPKKPNFETRSSLIRKVLDSKGEKLFRFLIHHSVFTLGTCMLEDVADVIFELMHVNREAASKWLWSALEQMPIQMRSGQVFATKVQFEKFHSSIFSASSFKAVNNTLIEFARLYH